MIDNIEKCPLCRGIKNSYLFDGKDRLHSIPGEFKIYKCNECGVVFTTPFLYWEDIKRYYPEEYETYQQRDESKLRKYIQNWGVARKYNIIRKYKRGGRLLDIGCSKGEFLSHLAKSNCWELFGIEPDPKAASLAMRVPGVSILNQRWEEINYEKNMFDVITMWHVFEHIPDPHNTLIKLHEIIKPGGILILALPNSSSIYAKLFGKYWSGYDVPRHYFAYSFSLLRDLLIKHGFTIVDRVKFIGEFSAFRYSMFFWLDDYLKSNRLRLLLKNLINNIIFQLCMTPFFILTNLIENGSTMVVISRKK